MDAFDCESEVHEVRWLERRLGSTALWLMAEISPEKSILARASSVDASFVVSCLCRLLGNPQFELVLLAIHHFIKLPEAS